MLKCGYHAIPSLFNFKQRSKEEDEGMEFVDVVSKGSLWKGKWVETNATWLPKEVIDDHSNVIYFEFKEEKKNHRSKIDFLNKTKLW